MNLNSTENAMKQPVIVSAVRTPIGKAKRGRLRDFRPDDLAGLVIKEALNRLPELPNNEVDDIILGCAMPEGEQGMNVGNIAKFVAGLPHSVSAMTINRFCSSGLQSIAMANDSVVVGRNKVTVAGGAESMTMIPMAGNKISPNPDIVDSCPEVYMGMGSTAERVAEQYNISREAQDMFAYESHQKAIAAQQTALFEPEIVPVSFERRTAGPDGKIRSEQVVLKNDEGPRADTSVEALSQLKTVFKVNGTVTAGNSSQMSDGAACVVIMDEEEAKDKKIKPIARLVGYSVAGVPPEIMGIGPIEAIPKVLRLCGLEGKDIGLIELNEAFASQSLAIINTLHLDKSIVNVNGGAIALGHPLGATGAILTVKLINEMKRRQVKYGMVTMCIGGGMGAAGIIENL